MKKVNPKKLIPTSPIGDTSTVSPNILIPASNVTTKSYARVDDDIDTPQQQELKQQTIVLKTKFIELEKLFGEKTKLEKDKNRRKRLNDERKKREKNENLKESQKTKFNFGNKLPRLELPRTGFLDTIKRFLLYGLLGFAIDKLGPAIPGLLKLGSKILPAIQFFGNLVGNIANNVIGFIDTGYKVFDFVKSQVSDIVGPEISSEFGKFSGVLNSALNSALIVGTAVLGAGGVLGKIGIDKGKLGTAAGLAGGLAISRLTSAQKKEIASSLLERRSSAASRRGTIRDQLLKKEIASIKARQSSIQKSKDLEDYEKMIDVDELTQKELVSKRKKGKFRGVTVAGVVRSKKRELLYDYESVARVLTGRERNLAGRVTISGEKGTRSVVDAIFEPEKNKFKKFTRRAPKKVEITRALNEIEDPDELDRRVKPSDFKKNQSKGGKNLTIGDTKYSKKLGMPTKTVNIPGLGARSFKPKIAESIFWMAKTYGPNDFLVQEIFKSQNPEFYADELREAYRGFISDRSTVKYKGPKPQKPIKDILPEFSSVGRTPKEISGLKGASKVKGLFGKLAGPLLGGLVDFFISLLSGDPPGLAISSAVGAAIGTAIGTAIGSAVLPVAGSFIGGVAGGFVGSSLFEMLYNRIIGKRQERGDLSKNISTSATRKVAPAKPITLSEEERKNYNVTPIITSRFGATESFRGGKPHGGSDLAVPVGTPLVAVSKGKIIETGYEPGWGNFIVFTDINGMYHLYGHLQSIRKTSGSVSRGEIIGYSGATGRVTGPHLHWELGSGWNGTITGKVDPLNMWNMYAPFATKSQSKASANLKQPSSNIAAGLQDQAEYDQSGYNIALLPIIDEIEKVVPVPMGGGGATIVNSNTPSIFAPALIG